MTTPPHIKAALNEQIPFGKHRGLTLRKLLEEDPGYMVWLNDLARKPDGDPDGLRSQRFRHAVTVVYDKYKEPIEQENARRDDL